MTDFDTYGSDNFPKRPAMKMLQTFLILCFSDILKRVGSDAIIEKTSCLPNPRPDFIHELGNEYKGSGDTKLISRLRILI